METNEKIFSLEDGKLIGTWRAVVPLNLQYVKKTNGKDDFVSVVVGEQTQIYRDEIPEDKINQVYDFLDSQRKQIEEKLIVIDAQLERLKDVSVDSVPDVVFQNIALLTDKKTANSSKARKFLEELRGINELLIKVQQKKSLLLEKNRWEESMSKLNPDLEGIKKFIKH